MKNNDWKDRLNVVYSTNPDYQYENIGEEEAETLPKNQQKLRVSMEKKGRGGKTVTLICGFFPNVFVLIVRIGGVHHIQTVFPIVIFHVNMF